jgi:hypothetical protein
MTRLNVSPQLPPKPTSVALRELAITAGVAGRCITMRYQEFPALILRGLWRYLITFAGSIEVQQVRTQADVSELAERVSKVRLARSVSGKWGWCGDRRRKMPGAGRGSMT